MDSASAPRVGAIVTAGGKGARFGGQKQFALLAGETVLTRSVRAAAEFALQVVVVVPSGEVERSRRDLEPLRLGIPCTVVEGGATRARSVRCGLEALPPELDLVVVHDGVRPMASADLFRRVVAAAVEVGAAVPGVPCTETVKSVEGSRVLRTLDRATLRLIQTPQAFRIERLRLAWERLGESASAFTDEAGLCEAAGFPVALVEGEVENVKITSPFDLARLAGSFGPSAPLGRPRIGMGYDVHPFAPGRRLVLGGVEFEGDGLEGHSDADAVAHAVADAILGAAGIGDLGHHFPDTDPSLRGVDSLGLLRIAVRLARDRGLAVENVDLTVAARRPKIAPAAPQMRERLALALGVSVDRVNVKATSGEGLGFVGREEGIAVHAVALLWPL